MGKEVAALGVLMLDCPHFEVPGSLSSDETVPFPLRRREVRGATVERMMAGSDELRASIIEAARELERTGVKAIVGNCGFMALFQKVLQENVNVPVFASSLLFVPLVARIIPKGKRVGILTFHALHLKEAHFRETGWSSSEIPIAIAGIQHQRAWQHPFRLAISKVSSWRYAEGSFVIMRIWEHWSWNARPWHPLPLGFGPRPAFQSLTSRRRRRWQLKAFHKTLFRIRLQVEDESRATFPAISLVRNFIP